MLWKTIAAELEAKLAPCAGSPSTDARGRCEWKRFGDGTERLDVKLRRLHVPDGSAVYVTIEGRPVGSVVVSDGRGRLVIEGGEGAGVPEVCEGEVVRVTAESGPHLEGTFVPD